MKPEEKACVSTGFRKGESLDDMFERRTERVGDCMEWTGAIESYGYGIVHIDGIKKRAHRVSYTMRYGEFSDELLVCHTCDNRKCVNPEHLFLGTQQDNLSDMAAKGRSTLGSRHPQSVLNESDVVEIRKLIKEGTPSVEIARKYGVTRGPISAIKRGLTWKHVL